MGIVVALLVALATGPEGAETTTTPATANARASTSNVTVIQIQNARPDNSAFLFPQPSHRQYPNLSVNGKWESKFGLRTFSPQNTNDPRWNVIRADPLYNKLPQDVLVGQSKFDHSYQFQIDGKLDENLLIHYDIQQEPDFPGKYDISVRTAQDDLTFFHFDAEFVDGEFINLRKALDGVRVSHRNANWYGLIANGRQRSEPSKLETFGNGTRTLRLGNANILEDSIKVWVNNIVKTPKLDYTINFYTGEITFTDRIHNSDFVKVIYEFTNPIADFIPTLSRKDFFGFQYKWEPSLKPVTSRITKPVAEVLWTSANVIATSNTEFQLNSYPVALGSELVQLNGLRLSNNRDYYLKHTTGKLVLLNTKMRRNDVLTAAYSAFRMEHRSDTMVGRDTTGPYVLTKGSVVDGSEMVYLDNNKLEPVRDYIIDTDKGKLYFNYSIAYPRIISVDYNTLGTQTVTPSATELPLRVGITYLSESSRVDSGQTELRSPTESITVSPNARFHVQQTPIISSKNVVAVLANGLPIPAANIRLVNAYTGEFQLVGIPAQPIRISYFYSKSYPTILTVPAKSIDSAFYENGNQMTLRDVPVRFNGIREIRIFTGGKEFRLTPKVDFVVEYGRPGDAPDGVNLRFRFLKQNVDSITSTLRDYPKDGDTLTVFYDYSPNLSPDSGNVSQQQMGITVGSKLSNDWRVGAELSVANNNFSRPRERVVKEFTGTGQVNGTYNLENINVVENSESVFFNGVKLNKDVDYIINYNTGFVSFRNLTPQRVDTIRTEFERFVVGATTAGQVIHSYATKLFANFVTQNITFQNSLKLIDANYLPISRILDKPGTFGFGSQLDWKMSNEWSAGYQYSRQEELIGKRPDNTPQFLYTDDFNMRVSTSFYDGWITTSENARYKFELKDPSQVGPSANITRDVDRITVELGGEVGIGPSFFRNTIKAKESRVVNDFLDGLRQTVDDTYSVGYSSIFRYGQQPWVESLTISPFAERSKRSFTDVTFNVQSNESRFARGVAASYVPITWANVDWNWGQEDIYKMPLPTKDVPTPSATLNTIRNTLLAIRAKPYSWLELSQSASHRETESPLLNQKGRVDDSVAYGVERFVPYGAILSLPAVGDWLIFYPIQGSYFTAGLLNTNSGENNFASQTSGAQRRLTYHNFEPIQGIRFGSVAYELKNTDQRSIINSRSVSSNVSNQLYSRKSGDLSIRPSLPLLNLLSYTLTIDDVIDNQFRFDNAPNATSNTTTREAPRFIRKQSINATPIGIPFGIPWVWMMSLGDFGAGIDERYESLLNKRVLTLTDNRTHGVVVRPVLDDSISRSRRANATYNPFNLLKTSGYYELTDEFLNRNANAAIVGTTFRNGRAYGGNAIWSPGSVVHFSVDYSKSFDNQLKSPTINMSLEGIRTAQTTQNPLEFQQELDRQDTNRAVEATYTPASYFSWTNKGSANSILERLTTIQSGRVNNLIEQIVAATGVKVKIPSVFSVPAGMSIGYTVSAKNTWFNAVRQGFGYQGNLAVLIAPPITKDINVNLSISRQDTLGIDINTLDQQTAQNSAKELLKTTVTPQDNTVILITVGLTIRFPIASSKYLEKFEITGEGFLKSVSDRMDHLKPVDVVKNTLSLGGISIKGTATF